jgi:hypothetical protein
VGEKVWVIKTDKAPGPPAASGDQSYADIHERIMRSKAAGTAGSKGQRAVDIHGTEEQGSAGFTVFAYILGPLSVIATSHGRQSRFWIAAGVASVIVLEYIALRARSLFAAPQDGRAGFAVWCLIAIIMTIAAFAAWSRGVALLGARRGWHMRRLPGWIRQPGAAAILGLVLPGFGLYVAGHPRRAVAALFGACTLAVSILALHLAPGLWRWNRETGALRGDALERIFVFAGALGLFGALCWIFQWLDGARLAGYRTGQDDGMPGDWSAFLLLIVIAAFAVTFHPADVAQSLDRFAVSGRAQGLELIPLYASEAAMHLDPSQPAYAMRAAALNDRLGRTDEARAIRQRLDARWKAYEMSVTTARAAAEGPPR